MSEAMWQMKERRDGLKVHAPIRSVRVDKVWPATEMQPTTYSATVTQQKDSALLPNVMLNHAPEGVKHLPHGRHMPRR